VPALLSLPSSNLVANGVQRAVYLHPTDDAKLVKVLRPDVERPTRNTFNGIVDRLLPSTRIRQIRKEYGEYLRVMLQHPEPEFHLPISHMLGFVTTDKGLGCLTERVMAPDGTLGTTLRSKVTEGSLTSADLDLLNDTIARIFANGIRASDMNANNFVFGHRDQHGTLGPRECVLVDGFGDIHAIPVRSWGRWANEQGLIDSCTRLSAKNNLKWSKADCLFRLG